MIEIVGWILLSCLGAIGTFRFGIYIGEQRIRITAKSLQVEAIAGEFHVSDQAVMQNGKLLNDGLRTVLLQLIPELIDRADVRQLPWFNMQGRRRYRVTLYVGKRSRDLDKVHELEEKENHQ
jgi:hypothetical protein